MNETVLNQALETERRKNIFAYMVERFKEFNQINHIGNSPKSVQIGYRSWWSGKLKDAV